MGIVKSIEDAVEALPRSELAEFRSWFAEFDAVAWDQQLESDAAAGKLDALAADALADYRASAPHALWSTQHRIVSGNVLKDCRVKCRA